MDIGKSPCDQTLDAFATHSGLFQFGVMPFGLAVVPLLGVFGRYYILWDHI